MVDHATLNSNDSLSKRIAILHVDIRVAIVGIATLIWFAVPLVLQGPPKRPPAFVVFIVAYIVFLCVNCVIFDCFAVGQARVRDLSAWLCLALFFTDIIVWALFHLASQHVTEFYIILLVWVVQSIIGMLAVMLLTQLYFNVYPKRHICAVIAGTDYEKRTLAKMSGVSNRFIVEEIIDQKRVNPDAVGKLAPQCNTIFIGEIDSRLRQAIVDDCFQKSRMTVVLPTITNVLFTGYKPTQVSDTLLFSQGNMGISTEQKFFKRIVDIIGSIIGIIICAIPIAICAIIIKVTDGGDVFYRQDRLTRNGKVFEMIKLRSMSMDAEKNGVRTATKGDERVTGIGRFMRRIRLDETPQFFNVLKGDIPLRILKTRPEFSEKSMGAFALPAKSSTNRGKAFSQVASCFASGLRTCRISEFNCNRISGMETQFFAKPVFGIPPVHTGALFQKSNSRLAEAAW